ncbi:hypothetical protein [Helicobacter heilmannii]|uniref:hypothetical protein n=1 Tax=Helicobacter heilmannii TaxID=35817 RepID=UPI00131571EB|nr:hypothetical protein [Helicobacter heilmannii]
MWESEDEWRMGFVLSNYNNSALIYINHALENLRLEGTLKKLSLRFFDKNAAP